MSTKKAKTITITPELEEMIYLFIDDELDWHINNCEPEEYKEEIEAQLELLRLLGYEEISNEWKEDYNRAIIDEDKDPEYLIK